MLTSRVRSSVQAGWQHFTFESALRGDGCERNWLDGTHAYPRFVGDAPALLGFDETIYAYCSRRVGLYGSHSARALSHSHCIQRAVHADGAAPC
jgi:hypothetical protein